MAGKISGPLSDREHEVLEFLLDGHNNESIGNQLDITVNTVKRHLMAVFSKLGHKTRTELVIAVLKERHAIEIQKARNEAFDFQSN